MKSKNKWMIGLAIIAMALAQLACGAPSGTKEIDNAVDAMVENQEEVKYCNLSVLGIGGITDAETRLGALESCTPKAEEQEKYDDMVEAAESEIAVAKAEEENN